MHMSIRGSFIDGLYKILEQQQQERELVKEENATPPVKSLEEQLVMYFRSLSPAQLSRPFTMNEIIMSGNLTGKMLDRPHPQQVAEVQTRKGWTKRRLYGVEYGGKRYCFPTM